MFTAPWCSSEFLRGRAWRLLDGCALPALKTGSGVSADDTVVDVTGLIRLRPLQPESPDRRTDITVSQRLVYGTQHQRREVVQHNE